VPPASPKEGKSIKGQRAGDIVSARGIRSRNETHLKALNLSLVRTRQPSSNPPPLSAFQNAFAISEHIGTALVRVSLTTVITGRH
jgi:hypothetical protein